jgi:hypothetical protein
MLKTTLQLKSYLNSDNSKRDGIIIDSLANTILKCGTKKDALFLLENYLENPFDFDHRYLLKIFRKFGDVLFAEKIFMAVIKDNKLDEDADPEIMELIGDLKYEPVKKILAYYLFEQMESDYYFQAHAARGLLNFDCKEYQQQIKDAIKRCYNKNLFPEFIPALICKLSDRNSYLEPLYELGNEFASTDCNGGILLGFSLCKEEGEHYFRKALFNPNWEILSGGTGSIYFAYQGLKNLNIPFTDLYLEIRKINTKNELEYALQVLFSLFDQRVKDYDDKKTDSFMSLYTTFYSRESLSEKNNLFDLAEQTGKTREVYEFERLFELKLTEEIMMTNYCI